MRGRRLLFFLSSLVASVWADYFIDDTNTTLTYSSGPKAAWGPFAAGGSTLELLLPNNTYQVIDPYVCYNHTYRYAACFGSDTCLLTIPFTGSGIAIYVYQAGPVGINASITVDGGHAATNVLNAPPAPNYEIANVTMFDVQELQSGPHSLNLLINDLLGSYSGMMFDYAYINETLVTSTPTSTGSSTATSGASTSSPSSNSSSGSSTSVGPIVGGVIGGVAVIAAGVIAFLCLRRRKTKKDALDLNADGVVPYDPHAAYDPPRTSQLPSAVTYTDSTTNMASLQHMPLSPNRRNDSSTNVTTLPVASVVTPFTSASTSSASQDRKTRLALANDTSEAVLSPGLLSSDSALSTQNINSRQNLSPPSLTDEQADFINSLYNNNVPAAAIARVMERMLVDGQAGIREWERETRLARSNTLSTAPPGYYDDPSAEQGI